MLNPIYAEFNSFKETCSLRQILFTIIPNNIKNYKIENAENLSFEDKTIDFILCKESYHHFPRPMVALYEMLRVARNGVLLIEPNDAYIINKYSEILFRNLKNIVKTDTYYS